MDKVWPELDNKNRKKYEFEAICFNEVIANKSENHLPGLYYLVLWKNYLEVNISYIIPSEAYQHLPQKASGKVDSDVPTD